MRPDSRLQAWLLVLLTAASSLLLGFGPAVAEPPARPSTSAADDPNQEPTGEPSDDPSQEPTDDPSDDPSQEPTDDPTDEGVVQIRDAALRWGLNNESSNKAFAPDTYNFFSAGKVPNPGRGGQTLAQRNWKRSHGAVRIEKFRKNAWQPATWAGLSTDSSDKPLTSPTEGRFSNHSFVFTGGTGTHDGDSGKTEIAWKGSVTVLYYSGMSFFYLTDPKLSVTNGRGQVTATLSGYASSQEDPDVWSAVPPQEVTVATLSGVRVSARGFTVLPEYAGVKVTGVPQVGSGAFPQSMVDFMVKLGTAAFWHASGASTDKFKVATAITVSFDADDEVEPPDPDDDPPADDPIDNTAIDPPNDTDPLPQSDAPEDDDADTTVTDPRTPPVSEQIPTAAANQQAPQYPFRPVSNERIVPVAATGPPEQPTWAWWAGGGLLLAAATLMLVPIRRRRPD